jgi:myo-inositol-1(or 4)-monophosphatase
MLAAVIEATRLVAQSEVLERFRSLDPQRHGRLKADGTQLSHADEAAQAALAGHLRAIADLPFLGEEMAAQEQARVWASGERLWCVDPVDGTTNFLQGLPNFAVSVALIERGRSTLGVVYNPVSDELFAAQRGGGATLNGVPIELPSPKTSIGRAVIGIDPKYLPRMLAMNLVTDPPYYSMRNFGAGSLDWCYLALGRFDAYLHGGQKLWDYAAGALIYAEAGGRLATFERDDFWAADPWTRSIIAANGERVFDEWCAWVRRAGGFRPQLIEA